MANVIANDIDFSAYLDMTDREHKIIPASAYADAVIDAFYGDQTVHGAYLPWGKTHANIRFGKGQVTLWTGFNGHGKTLLLSQAVLSFVAQGERVLVISPEMKPAALMARSCRQAACSAQPAMEFIRSFHAWTGKGLWLYDQQGMIDAKKITAIARYFAERHRGTHVVIDSLLKCGVGQDDFNAQHAFVNELTSVARDTDLHIHLVAHSRKTQSESGIPSRFDVRGSGTITDQVDMVLTVWRDKQHETAVANGKANYQDKPGVRVSCDKNRHYSWEGQIGLWFHAASGQFCQDERVRPLELMSWPHEG